MAAVGDYVVTADDLEGLPEAAVIRTAETCFERQSDYMGGGWLRPGSSELHWARSGVLLPAQVIWLPQEPEDDGRGAGRFVHPSHEAVQRAAESGVVSLEAWRSGRR